MIARRLELKSTLLTETTNAAGIIAQCVEGKKLKFWEVFWRKHPCLFSKRKNVRTHC